MIIRCTKCGTEFDLDPTQVGPEGVTLRCSVCSHMFHAEPEPEGEALQPWRLATIDKLRFELADLREIAEHIEEGRLRPDDQISHTGQHWLKLGEMPEFSSLFSGFEGLPRVFRAIEASTAIDLGPPPPFAAPADDPAPVRREETVRVALGSLRDPLPEPNLPTLDDDGPLPAPPEFDSPPVRPRAKRTTAPIAASSPLDAVTKVVVGEGEEPDAPSESTRTRSQPILVSDLARKASQSVEATVQRVEGQRASERAAREKARDGSDSRRLPLEELSQARPEPGVKSATAAAVAAAVASTPMTTTVTLQEAPRVEGSTMVEVPRAPEVVIVKVAEPAGGRSGSGAVFALAGVIVAIGVVFGVPSIRERMLNLGQPTAVQKTDAKAPTAEQGPEFTAARNAMRTLGLRESRRALGGLQRVVDDPERDPKVITAAKLAQAELMLMRAVANQIAVSLDPAAMNGQAQALLDEDLPYVEELMSGIGEVEDAEALARVRALQGLVQGLPEAEVVGKLVGESRETREVRGLALGAPLWRQQGAPVPSGLITSLRSVPTPSTLNQTLLSLALWRGGDDEGARTVLDGVLGRIGDMPAARTLRGALDRSAAEKGETLPPPPEPPPEPAAEPEATPEPAGGSAGEPGGEAATSPSKQGGGGTRPQPSPGESAIDTLIQTGCQKVRNSDPAGGIKLLLQAVDKGADPRHFEMCMCMGTGFAAMNNHDTALTWFKRAAAQSPTNRDAVAGVARAAELANKKAVAIEYYRKLLDLEPGNQTARNYLAKHDDSGKPTPPPPEDAGDLLPVKKKTP